MLLRNPIYLGKVDFKGERYEGEHDAIVDAPLFDQVQRTLDAKACGRGPRRGRNPECMRVAEPGMAARIQEQRAEAEAKRLALRAEADKLMRSLGHEASGRASHLLAERIGAIEAEFEPVHARIAQLDGEMQALQRTAEQVTQT
ncbi:MAG: hypothetical protein H5U40_01005, partial [Polyangiaceae bacterium]|nr:hypothetical protein [Polyangiaceae bacterium]